MLEGGGRGQHDIGVVHRVGGKELVDHREEVLAAQALHDLVLLGSDRRRVRVVDEEGLHRRGEALVGEGTPELAHVEGPGARRREVGALENLRPHRERARGGEQHASPHVAPGPRHRGQARDRPHRHPPAGVAVQAVVETDGRGPRGAVGSRKPLDFGFGQAGDRRGPRGRPFLRPLLELGGALGVAIEVVLVLEPVTKDHVHHAEGEGRIGSGEEGEVTIGVLGRLRPVGIDGHDPGAATAGLLDEGPEVDVGADDVGAPGHDEPGVDDGLGIEPQALPHRGLEPGPPGARADGPGEQAGPDLLEEATVQAAVGEQAHVAGI